MRKNANKHISSVSDQSSTADAANGLRSRGGGSSPTAGPTSGGARRAASHRGQCYSTTCGDILAWQSPQVGHTPTSERPPRATIWAARAKSIPIVAKHRGQYLSTTCGDIVAWQSPQVGHAPTSEGARRTTKHRGQYHSTTCGDIVVAWQSPQVGHAPVASPRKSCIWS